MLSAERRRFIVLVFFCLLYGLLAFYSERWLLRETEGRLADDFGIYYQAYSRARAGENPYAPYKIGLSFIYHPFALTWISLFDWHSIRTAAILWMTAGASAWIASLVLALRLLFGCGSPPGVPRPRKVWVYLAIFLMLTFAPLGESIHVGQINGFVTCCLVMALYGSERSGLVWEVVAAVALGLAVLLKTSPIVLMLYWLALHRYRLLLLTIASLVILSIVTAIQFSPALVLQFVDTVLRIGSGIHYSRYNQSILRLAWQFLRALGISGVDGWLVRVLQATSAVFFALSSGSAWLMGTSHAPARLLLFNLLLALMVVSSPIVWYHHSTLLLLPILSLILHQDRRVRWLGLAAVLLIQSERALESAGITSGAWAGLPALAGQITILLLFVVLYAHNRWPMLRACSGLTLWRR